MTTPDSPTTQVTPSPILGRPNSRKRHKTNAQTSSTPTKNKSLHTSEKHFCTKKQVIECELHTIHEALSWISENSAPSDKYVIFTDSLSFLYLIRSTKPKYYIPLAYNIQNKLINIISSHCIRLQFIPGHRGVSGNEAADSTAKAAHLLRYRTLTPYSKEETVSLACKAFRTRDSTWLQQVRVTGKVRHLVQIRDTSGSWPWASHRNRRVETALTRLRVGHTGFRSHLFRVNQTNDLNCPCGRVETIEHVLFNFLNYSDERANLTNTLTSIDWLTNRNRN
ncbi:Ribonuclease H domain [Trinorchestia longiramus]|nr:Ribonuclease H domain [Trinorchestia longiramus]